MPDSLLLFGIGNDGDAYHQTRHNAGVDLIRFLAKRYGGKWTQKKKFNCSVATIQIGKVNLELVQPHGYINESGPPIAKRLRQHTGLALLAYDEMDFEPGKLRLREGAIGSSHNGMRSIKQHTNDERLVKIRIGVGRPATKDENIRFLLSRPSAEDQLKIIEAFERIEQSIALIADQDWQAVMRAWHLT